MVTRIMPLPPIERRQAPRFPASYAVETDHGIGVTENLSLTGVSFVTSAWTFGIGDLVGFSMSLEEEASVELILMHCHGRVIRADARERGMTAIAVTIESFWFETSTKESGRVN